MYTSGCPKIQNRCSQIIVLPPNSGLKKFVPNKRSSIISAKPTVSGGNANKMSADATNVVHVNSGNLIYVKPGALILIIVARKLIPAISVPKPDICSRARKVYAVPFRIQRK